MTVATVDHSGHLQDVRSVTRLALRMYKSIEKCDIELAPLTIFVGRNGSGKSNLLDALRFVADALLNDLDFAIRERGGIDHVRRKSLGGRATHPGVSVELRLSERETANMSSKSPRSRAVPFVLTMNAAKCAGLMDAPGITFGLRTE